MCLNARSIINKTDILQATVLDLLPDVIGITESWTHENILDSELNISGFRLFRCDRKIGYRGGGVLLYVRDSLNPVEYNTHTGYGEHVWCKVNNLLIGLCYRSDNLAIVGQHNESDLKQVLHEVSNNHVLVMGDFNYSGIDWSSSSTLSSAGVGSVDFLQTVESCFLTQHVLTPTRENAILDLVLTRDPDLVSDVNVLHPLGTSDHNMIVFTVHLDCEARHDDKVIRDYKNGDYDTIRSLLTDIDWDSFMSGAVNDNWLKFKDLLHSLIDEYIPLKINSKKQSLQKPIWMTHKALKLIRKKRKTFTKFKDAHHPAVKSACKAAKSEIRKARKSFERKLAQNIKHDLKSFYAYARSKSKCKVHIGPLTNGDGNMISSASDIWLLHLIHILLLFLLPKPLAIFRQFRLSLTYSVPMLVSQCKKYSIIFSSCVLIRLLVQITCYPDFLLR